MNSTSKDASVCPRCGLANECAQASVAMTDSNVECWCMAQPRFTIGSSENATIHAVSLMPEKLDNPKAATCYCAKCLSELRTSSV